jgi:hypothetical protein
MAAIAVRRPRRRRPDGQSERAEIPLQRGDHGQVGQMHPAGAKIQALDGDVVQHAIHQMIAHDLRRRQRQLRRPGGSGASVTSFSPGGTMKFAGTYLSDNFVRMRLVNPRVHIPTREETSP